MSESNILTGRVWKFGDNISTDLIMPSFGAMSSPNMDPHEAALFCMRANRPDWAEKVRPGDIVIAGKNFGCGSKSTWRPERFARWTPGERSVVRRCPLTVLPHRSSAPAV